MVCGSLSKRRGVTTSAPCRGALEAERHPPPPVPLPPEGRRGDASGTARISSSNSPVHGPVQKGTRRRHNRTMQRQREQLTAARGRMSGRSPAEKPMRVVRTNFGPCSWDAGPAVSHLSHLIPVNPAESRKKGCLHPIPPPPVPLPPEERRGDASGTGLLSLSAPGGGEGRGEVGVFFSARRLPSQRGR